MDVLRTLELGSRDKASRKVISKVCRAVYYYIMHNVVIDRSGRVSIKQLPLVRADRKVWYLLSE